MNEPQQTTVTLIPGDGIGPECMVAVRRILEAAGAPIRFEECEAGASVFRRGLGSGVPKETIDSIARNRVALKGPLETPVGYGEKSANVTLRKLFELYGNIRPTQMLPGVQSIYAGRPIDLVVVRENIEDLYTGIEHMQTPGVAQCLKVITNKGCERIVRLAFELARAEGRRKVTCVTKANIMKLTEGLLKRTFEAIAPEYPGIQTEHMIVDNCAHQLVRRPEQMDVLVMTNMNGDILSDLAAGLAGGLGIAPSANLGDDAAIFEAVHGSAPDIAGQDRANPTALLLAAVLMLRHFGWHELATKIEHALIVTLEEGTRVTGDLASRKPGVTTTQFTEAIVEHLGRRSPHWGERPATKLVVPRTNGNRVAVRPTSRRTVGVDVFLEADKAPGELGRAVEAALQGAALSFAFLGNRGSIVHPAGATTPDCVDHWRVRLLTRDAAKDVGDAEVLDAMQRLATVARWNHVEKLYEFDGIAAFSKEH